MNEVLPVAIGLVIGAGTILAVMMLRRRHAADVARELIASAQKDKLEDLDRITAQLKETFGSLSREALTVNSAEFLRLARTRLEQETARGGEGGERLTSPWGPTGEYW